MEARGSNERLARGSEVAFRAGLPAARLSAWTQTTKYAEWFRNHEDFSLTLAMRTATKVQVTFVPLGLATGKLNLLLQ